MNHTEINHSHLSHFTTILAKRLSISTAFIGFVVLWGWIFNVPLLKSVLPGLVTMKVNTALGFLFGGISLFLCLNNYPKAKIKIKYISLILAFIVFLLGFLTLIEYSFNINLGIDQLLIKDSPNAIYTSSPGRMSPNTAVCFFFLGVSLILFQARNFVISQTLALFSFLISLLGLVGYIFGISKFYYLPDFSGMALHTSISFVFFSVGSLLMSSQYGWMQQVISPYMGGKIARIFLPLSVIIPIFNSGVFLNIENLNILNTEMAFLLPTMINIFVLGGLAWWNTKYVNKIDRKNYYLQQELQAANKNLEDKVNQRTQELKEINQQLREHKDKLSNLINTLPGIVFTRDTNNNFVFQKTRGVFFRTIFNLLSMSGEEIKNYQLESLIVPEDLPKIERNIETAIKNNDQYDIEYRIISPAGEEKWLWEKGVIISNGKSNKIQGYITDITTLKNTQSALENIKDRFNILAENIDEVFHINSADLTQILYISPAYEKIWGESCQTIYEDSYTWSNSIHPDDCDRILAACQSLIAGEPLNEEYRIINKNGEIRWICDHTSPIFDESGQILHHVGVARDITERKQYELEIKQLNEQLETKVEQRTAQLTAVNKELEAFSYSVSHDLRSPLRGIDGFSKTLLQRYGDQLDEKGKHYLTRIRIGTQQMGELIDDLLKLSRITRHEMEFKPVNLSVIAQKIAQQLSEAEPTRQVKWTINPDLIVSGDSHLLTIVIENLFNNAWKFTSKKTQTKIEMTYQVSQHTKNDHVIYIIRDNGVGFDQTYVNKIFTAFQRLHTTAEFPGTGIGLATVQRIIRRHGGDIWAEGILGEGATFYFTLNS